MVKRADVEWMAKQIDGRAKSFSDAVHALCKDGYDVKHPAIQMLSGHGDGLRDAASIVRTHLNKLR